MVNLIHSTSNKLLKKEKRVDLQDLKYYENLPQHPRRCKNKDEEVGEE